MFKITKFLSCLIVDLYLKSFPTPPPPPQHTMQGNNKLGNFIEIHKSVISYKSCKKQKKIIIHIIFYARNMVVNGDGSIFLLGVLVLSICKT